MDSVRKTFVRGLLVYRVVDWRVEILLLKKMGANDWGPPKGKKEPTDESDLHTAIRETFEETGLSQTHYQISKFNFPFEYVKSGPKGKVLKKVVLWPAQMLFPEKVPMLSHEHDDYKWLEINVALKRIKVEYKEILLDIAKKHLWI